MNKTTHFKLKKENGSYLTFSVDQKDRVLTVERAAFIGSSDQDELLTELCRHIVRLKGMKLRCRSHFPLSFTKDLDCRVTIDEIVD